MRSSPASRRYPPAAALALIVSLTFLLSGWTCSAFFSWGSCQKSSAQLNVTSVSPDTISSDVTSVLLTVEGSGFTPQSQVLWNGSALDTTFVNSQRVETTITQETFALFGGSTGDQVLVSVRPRGIWSNTTCPNDVNSSKDGDSKAQVLHIH